MKLPVLSGKEIVRFLKSNGFEQDHQTGSHLILRQPVTPFKRVTVPMHKVIVPGTLLKILKEADLTREDLEKFLD